MRVRVYEIEHQGDLSHAVDALRQAGARNVQALATDFEGSESAVLSFDAPEGTDPRDLLAKAEEEGDLIL